VTNEWAACANVSQPSPTISRRSGGALYSQRRRIAAQHLVLRRLRGYRPTTTELRHVLRAVNIVVTESAGRWPLIGVLAAMESVARLHGRWDVRRRRDYRLWHVSQTRQSLAVGNAVRIWITGGAGYVGSAVARACQDRGLSSRGHRRPQHRFARGDS